MRRFLSGLILLLAVYFALSQFSELQRASEVLQRGNFLWIGLAIVVQLTWLVNLAVLYRAVYRLLNMEVSLPHLLPLVVTSNFVNVVAPSAGMSGMAVFLRDARRHNLSRARVTLAGVLFVLFDYAGFLCVLMVGLAVLFRRNNLTAAEVGASLVLTTTALALAGLLLLGVRSARALERVLIRAARTINTLLHPLLRRDYLSEERAHTFALETAGGLSALRTGWRNYLLPLALALSSKALLITLLFLTFLAFKQPFSVGTLIAGFSIGFLSMIVSPTPMGIGVVEGAMTLALISLNVPREAATIITLAYRGLAFWLPFGYGFVTLRVLERRWRG
jgi:uncharacterized protein (TIRG00374 family)